MSQATLRTLDEVISDLSQPIPDEYLSTKKKGGQEITIFSWVTAQRFLDMKAPGWHGDAVLTYSGERVGCVYKLCIPTSDHGLVCRAASGDDQEDDEDETEQERRQRQYGTPTTRAEAQAFKRAAGRFGFGLDLRDKKSAGNAAKGTAYSQGLVDTAQEREELLGRLKSHFNKLGLSNEERRQVFEAIAGKPVADVTTGPLRSATEQVEKLRNRQAAIDLVDRRSSERRAATEPTPLRRNNV